MEKKKTTWQEKLVRFFGLNRSIAAVMLMVVLVGLDEKMAERFLPLYLLSLGGGIISVGLLNGLDNLLSALYSFPGGYLSDRLGYKRALIFFNLVALAGYLIVIVFPHWAAVLIGAVFFLAWTAISLPATMSLVAQALPAEKRTMGVSLHSLTRRLPMALGPLIGGLMIELFGLRTGVRVSFLVAFILGMVSLILQQVMIAEDGRRTRAEGHPFRLWQEMTPSLRRLLLSDILIRFAEQIPYAFVVVWCVTLNGISAFEFGVLTAVEMATAMAIYVPVAYLADRTTKKPFVLVTFVNFTLFPVVLLFCRTFPMMILAFVVRGLKEFGEPTRKALIMDLAPAERKAGVFGLYYLIRDIVVSGAAFAGAFLWQLSPEANLLTAAGFGAAGTLYFAWRGRDLKGEKMVDFP